MSKSLLHRLFGVGRIPKDRVAAFEQEGITLLEEGIGGSITFRNFRAPGRRSAWKRSWFCGSVVLTKQRFSAFSFSRSVIDVPLDSPELLALELSLKGDDTLRVFFDASVFHEGWSGGIEVRFATPKARFFLERLHVIQRSLRRG